MSFVKIGEVKAILKGLNEVWPFDPPVPDLDTVRSRRCLQTCEFRENRRNEFHRRTSLDFIRTFRSYCAM
jgi:hypothetical protein